VETLAVAREFVEKILKESLSIGGIYIVSGWWKGKNDARTITKNSR